VRESQWVAPLSNQYDAQDRVTIQQRGALYWTISYSGNNLRTLTRQRLSETPVPPPAVTTFQFDAVGHLTQKTDALGNKLEYTRAAGSPYVDLAKVWKAGTPLTLHKQADFDFDTAGNLTAPDHTRLKEPSLRTGATTTTGGELPDRLERVSQLRTEYSFYRDGPNPTDRPKRGADQRRRRRGMFERRCSPTTATASSRRSRPRRGPPPTAS
jgi:YD repeat-containing protein